MIYSIHYFEAPFDARIHADVSRRKTCGRSSQTRSPCALLSSPELISSLLPRCQQFVALAAPGRSTRYIPTRYPLDLFMWTPHALMPRKRQCMYLIYVEIFAIYGERSVYVQAEQALNMIFRRMRLFERRKPSRSVRSFLGKSQEFVASSKKSISRGGSAN